jgi:hypothetical protein
MNWANQITFAPLKSPFLQAINNNKPKEYRYGTEFGSPTTYKDVHLIL